MVQSLVGQEVTTHPGGALTALTNAVNNGEQINITRAVSEHSIRTALVLDSKLTPSIRDEFLDLVFIPAAAGDHTPQSGPRTPTNPPGRGKGR
jgi:hypothetical protein